MDDSYASRFLATFFAWQEWMNSNDYNCLLCEAQLSFHLSSVRLHITHHFLVDYSVFDTFLKKYYYSSNSSGIYGIKPSIEDIESFLIEYTLKRMGA